MNRTNQEMLDQEDPTQSEESEAFSMHVWWIAIFALTVLVLLIIANAVGGRWLDG
jgi:hypothetical protein